MPQECADFIGRLGRENVLELACLLLDFGFAIHGQAIRKEPLRQSVPPDNAARAFSASCGKLHNQLTIANRG
jgi:hypothetical protein